MVCRICQLNAKVLEVVEAKLYANGGVLFETDKREIAERFPESGQNVQAITDQDCSMHFNFHQRIARIPAARREVETGTEAGKNVSLAQDIGKDEAGVLYELLNSQAATFNALNTRIAKQISKADEEDRTSMLIHPSTMQLYKETADSIRATVRAIGDLNVALNGQKDGSLDGLMALAAALNGSRANTEAKKQTHPQDNPEDGTTTMFDD